jgi:hypothetical protein
LENFWSTPPPLPAGKSLKFSKIHFSSFLMNKYYLLLIPLLLLAVFAFAKTIDDITYPIAELGNCQNREDCSSYCDKIINIEACLKYAKDNGLPLTCDLVDVRDFSDSLKRGVKLLPCQTKSECLDFCSKPENMDQCLAFAEKTGILSRYEALLFKRTGGVGPGNCKNKDDCKTYCSKEENVDECLAYAEKYGFMTQEQVAEAVRLRDVALKGGPGGCVGLDQCKEYCSSEAHFTECINFGKENGIATEQEAQGMEQFAKTGGPGGCKTKQECDQYCQDPANLKYCLQYMVENNYLPKETAAQIESNIEQAEDYINQQLENFKMNFNLNDQEDEEIRKEIETKIQPYKDILNVK